MQRSYHIKFLKITTIIFVITAIVTLSIIFDYEKLPYGSVRKFDRQNEPRDVGPLRIGGKMPYGPGDSTLAPYLEIPSLQKFYVSVAEPDTWCINEDCNLDGAFIQTMGGWLQVEPTGQAEVKSSFGLDMPENQNIKSVVVVGDNKGKVVGIYPNKKLSDVISILAKYPALADFSSLSGVDEFNSLKVGELAPLKPGARLFEDTRRLIELPSNFPITVPDGKDFYIYALQKRKHDIVGMYERYENEYICLIGSCRYPEPDPPHDFLFAEIEELNGWFLANSIDNTEMIKLFGLDPDEVLSGEESLVVVTDRDGKILALHPNKTLSDTYTILSQIPKLRKTVSKIF